MLALLLLLSQQMAIAHAITHVGDGRGHTSQQSSQEKQLPAHEACAQCLAFAQIGSGLATASCSLPDHGPDEATYDRVRHASASLAPLRAFQSRAPPVFIKVD
jgi:hypothetical protein